MGVKRLTRAEQGQTGACEFLPEVRVGRIAKSRLEQKEGYGRHVPPSFLGWYGDAYVMCELGMRKVFCYGLAVSRLHRRQGSAPSPDSQLGLKTDVVS